jgi:hypothetical protein
MGTENSETDESGDRLNPTYSTGGMKGVSRYDVSEFDGVRSGGVWPKDD